MTEQILINIMNDNSISPKAISSILWKDCEENGYLLNDVKYPEDFNGVYKLGNCGLQDKVIKKVCNSENGFNSDTKLENLFDLIVNNPKWFKDIKGLNSKRIKQIYDVLLEKNIITKLQHFYLCGLVE